MIRDEVGILIPKPSLNQGHVWGPFGEGTLSLAGQAKWTLSTSRSESVGQTHMIEMKPISIYVTQKNCLKAWQAPEGNSGREDSSGPRIATASGPLCQITEQSRIKNGDQLACAGPSVPNGRHHHLRVFFSYL